MSITVTQNFLDELLKKQGAAFQQRIRYKRRYWDTVASPFVTWYQDFDLVDDYYVSFGIGFGGDLGEMAAWELGLTGAFAGENFARVYAGGTDSGLFDGNVSLSVSREVNDNWGLGVFIAYSDSLDSQVLPDQKVDVYGGLSISASF